MSLLILFAITAVVAAGSGVFAAGIAVDVDVDVGIVVLATVALVDGIAVARGLGPVPRGIRRHLR